MFLWHFPSAYAARVLPGTLPGGVRTFLEHGFPASRPPGLLDHDQSNRTRCCWVYGSSRMVTRMASTSRSSAGPRQVQRRTKTTVELSDALLIEARELANRENTTLRALIEAGLRKELELRGTRNRFRLRDASVDGKGMAPEFLAGGWPAIRDEIYRGRGT